MNYGAIQVLLLVACLHQSTSREINEVKTRWNYNDKNSNRKSLPDSIQMNFNLEDYEITLNLTRQKTNSPLVITQFKGERAIWKQPEDEVLGVYKDLSLDASATVTIKKVDDVEETSYMITFSLEDKFYALGPSKKIIISFLNAGENENKRTHILFNIDGSLHSLVEIPLSDSISYMIKGERNQTTSDQTKKRLMTVELFSAIDYSTFNKFFSESKATSDSDKREDAIKTILYVFTHIMEGVKERYESIKTEDVKFTIKWVGALIAESNSDVPLFDNESSETDLPILFIPGESMNKLNKLISEEPNKKIKLPNYDYLVAITSYKLIYHNKASYKFVTYQESTCKPYKFGIISHEESFSTISILSQCLGKSLGMQEDREGACDPKDSFIMAPVDRSPYYPLRFSDCSVSNLKKFISSLDGSKTNCLDFTSPVNITTSLPSTLSTKTTTTISPTNIKTDSVSSTGTTSNGKPNSAAPVTITVSPTSTISTTTLTTPYLSKATTSSLSSTVSSSTANPTNNFTDSCAEEDFDGTLEYVDVWGDKLYLDCKSLVRHVSNLCYDDAVQKYCCASCKSVKMDKEYCINGDYKSKNFDCKQLVENDPNHCGIKEFKILCCKSCGHAIIRDVEIQVDN